MEFCPKCGCVLIGDKKSLKCPRCSYKAKGKVKLEVSENLKKTLGVGVITDKDVDVFPITNANCPKCNHKEAYFWTSQARAADEAEVRFYRCTKCKHTWREYH
jgi:transcription factor S